jgi:protein SCO1/2
MNGLLDALKGMTWTPGKEYEIVTVSFDPGETPILAKNKKQNYLRELGRAEAATGWHFLTGRATEIKALTDAVGFGFRYNDERQEYMHVAALMMMSPAGTVSRYIYGIVYEPETIRLSLVEAAEGKVTSTLDRLILFCYHYDATEGRYTIAALAVARFFGLLTLAGIAGFLIHFWRREARPPISTTTTIEGHQT